MALHGDSLLKFSFLHRWHARILIVAISLSAAVAGLLSPFFQKVFVDQLLGSPDSTLTRLGLDGGIALVFALSIAFVCTGLAQLLALLAVYTGVREGVALQRIFGESLYKKMLSIRPDSMGSTTVGEVVSIFATDVPGSTAIIDQAIPMGGGILFPLLFAPLAIYWLCGFPIWASVLTMSVIVVVNVFLARRQAGYFVSFKQLAAERTGLVNEWVQNIRLLRILGWTESFEKRIFEKRVQETHNRVAMVTNGQVMGSIGSSISFVINLVGIASLVFLSGKPVQPGELFALLWIFGVFLSRPFRQVPWIFTFSLDSLSSMRRLERFLGRKSDAGSPEHVEEPVDAGVDALPLDVRGLNLRINEVPILENIDLGIRAGEFVAVVGEVGSGKSLLAMSLVGETGASFASFRLGSVDALKLALNQRRLYFGFVPQEGFVMSASLRENIAFRYEPLGEVDGTVEESLALAQFRVANEQLRNGLDTEIGERGVNLSGGQRQRVSLARAHHVDRPIIVLDDCLSAVDVDTEKQLLRELIEGAWRKRTRILVTHRLSVLNKVDRILFMENGRIVEEGTLEDLLAKSKRMRDYVASVRRQEAAERERAKGEDGEAENVS